MQISRAAIKHNAKSIISSSKPSPVLVGLVYLGIVAILQLLSTTVSGEFSMYMKTMEQMLAGNMDYLPTLPTVGLSGTLIGVAIGLMLMMMDTGFKIYCLHICQRRKAGFGSLFDGFAIFFKVVWLNILMFIFVYLWSLLLIIPGIIALYRYRMALFIMLENPEMSALACISASKEMIMGHKGELFVLDLSFLGWALLSLLPFVTIWVTPYTSVTYTNYYLALRDMPKQDSKQTFGV